MEIRKLIAIRPHQKIHRSGANLPMDVRCLDQNSGERCDVVVKFMGSERMGPVAASFELIANLMARKWGLWSPEPVLVDVSEDFIEMARGLELYSAIAKSGGLNFGTVKVENLYEVDSENVRHLPLGERQSVFSFDQWIDNCDRTLEKPNMMFRDDRLMIFDHELCFAFTRILFAKSYQPWKKSVEQMSFELRNSILYPGVRGQFLDPQLIYEAIGKMDENFLQQLQNVLPEEFWDPKVEMVLENMENMLKYRDEFVGFLVNLVG